METLRKLQLVETEMLATFDSICRKYNIPYFVIWGTLLGAKRHEGFIPWDDDIDVGMLREDYAKLKSVPQEEWGVLQLIDGESNVFFHEKVFPRIYKKGTVFESELWKKYTYNKDNVKKPVWIDIFLYDYVDSQEEALKKAKAAYRFHIMYYYSRYRTNIVSGDSLVRKLGCVARNILHVVLSIKSPNKYLLSYYRLVSKSAGNYLISFDNWTIEEIMASLCDPDLVFPIRDMAFEDIVVQAPYKTEKLLEQFYGNYMELPPEEKRVGHIPQSIFLGE